MSTPYTYLIGWSKQDMWYYGVRYSKNADPSDLWATYFTSSKYVKQFAKIYGKPDVIQVRRTFNDPTNARLWESRVLKRLNAVKSKRFLNRSYSDGSFAASSEHLANLASHNKGRTLSAEHKEKLSRAGRGKPKSKQHAANIAAALTGKHRPLSVRQKISTTRKQRGIRSSTQHMNLQTYYCEQCDKTMTKGNYVRWHSHQPSGTS